MKLGWERSQVSHFRVFGCAAYAHIPSDERRKLDSKSKKSVFLGYGEEVKGYRLFDLQKSKVYLSRDVIFDESSRGLDKASEENDGKRYVKIENDISDLSFSSTSDTAAPDSRDMSGSIASDHPAVAQEGEMSSMEAEPILPRSQRARGQPDRYGAWVNVTTEQSEDPLTLEDAMSSPDHKWKDAIKKEIDSLSENNVWDLIDLPDGKRVIGSKWVFKRKFGIDGTVERYKARLVAQGCSQKHQSNYDETHSVFSSIRICEDSPCSCCTTWSQGKSNGCNHCLLKWRIGGGSLYELVLRSRIKSKKCAD